MKPIASGSLLGLFLLLSSGSLLAQQAPAAPGGDGSAYTTRLRTLEKNLNEVGERVVALRGRMNHLKDTVLGGALGASRCVVRHKNEMGSTFRLIKAVYALDGVPILSKVDDTGRLAEMTEFDIYNGAIQPGKHTLSVQLTYQGHGFGVFSYLKNYKFDVRSAHVFDAVDTKATILTVVGYEKGNADLKMEDKPAVDFRGKVVGRDALEPPPAKK